MQEQLLVSWLLSASIISSILTAAIMLTKYFLGKRLGARWHYYIWFLLLLKLLIPYAPESSFSVFNIISYFSYQPVNSEPSNSFSNHTLQKYLRIKQKTNFLSNQDLSRDYPISAKGYNHFKILYILWLSGALTASSYMLIVNLRTFNILKNKYPVKNKNLLEFLEECKKQFGINADIKLMYTANMKTPALYGILSPCLLLPAEITDKLSKQQLKHIMLHELAHFKRKDIITSCLISFVQIIYWFNPIIAYALSQMRQDREIACDALALSRLEPDQHKEYGKTIIEILSVFSHSKQQASIVTLLGSKEHIKKRLTNIAQYRKTDFTESVFGIIIFVFVGISMLTNALPVTAGPEITNIEMKNKKINFADFSPYFKGFNGSFVLFDQNKNLYTIYNEEKTKERISPCSTFKVFDSLIALECGILRNESTKLKWDGITYPFAEWNRNHTLVSAMTYSVNWYFEQINQRIGKEKMQHYLRKIDYGNNDISGGIRNFWGQSTLKISPIEQVELLKKFYTYKLPFSKKNVDTVKRVIKLTKKGDAFLSGKTGTGGENEKAINGWFVGYVEKQGNVYFFATNIQSNDQAYGKRAKTITLDILKSKGILP